MVMPNGNQPIKQQQYSLERPFFVLSNWLTGHAFVSEKGHVLLCGTLHTRLCLHTAMCNGRKMENQSCSTICRNIEFLQCWRMSETAQAQKLLKN